MGTKQEAGFLPNSGEEAIKQMSLDKLEMCTKIQWDEEELKNDLQEYF